MALGRLRSILKDVADKQVDVTAIKDSEDLSKQNKAAQELFSIAAPVYRSVTKNGPRVDIQGRSLARVSVYMNRKHFAWRLASRDEIIKFLSEHWVDILRLLASLLLLVL